MSEIMRPLSFAALMEHLLQEYQAKKSIFGVRADRFYRNSSGSRISLFGATLDSPVGPAAGPHTQLANNIVAAYLAGSRFIELKTVQTMDGQELRNCVARPCINASDECYNVEWSTELTVQQALAEYVKAWIAVHVLGVEFDLGCNVIFNISVGYSLEGIQSPKIDGFIDGLKDASDTAIWQECQQWLSENLNRFTNFDAASLAKISPTVSKSITLSTLHGCPRQEIESIAHYLLSQKQLHTCIKCNPTLLGYAEARRILDEMGYDYLSFGHNHFEEDLQFDEAVAMFGRLKQTAANLQLSLGAKITNTFPVDIKRGELPGDEMYMSGRSLFPLSLTVASKLSAAFDGQLVISFSGGADAFNLADILKTGIQPVTVATTLLKPGGYERMAQLATIAEQAISTAPKTVDVALLNDFASKIGGLKRHQKSYRQSGSRQSDQALTLFDCAQAPCSVAGCPINQQIPAYLEQIAKGNTARAFQIIVNDNVLPSTTGTICDHQCQQRCTRLDYDDSLQIRSAKKAAVVAAQADFIQQIRATELRAPDVKVLVIGAGPAGLAAAIYLRRNGLRVTVQETLDKALGIVSHVIPDFRISDAELALDLDLATAYGVHFEFNVSKDYKLAELQQEYRFIVLATGAWKEGKSDILVDGEQVYDAIDFLARSRKTKLQLQLGKQVAIIGGGDVAMDCARAAARNNGVQAATLVYRRTREFMPAQPEEIELALADGVGFKELLAPKSFINGTLTCEVMKLDAVDSSGRRGIRSTGATQSLKFDTIVNAVGAQVETSQFEQNGIALDGRGFAELDSNNQTSVPDVYIAGDCKVGPKTVVQAMADAKLIAQDILTKLELESDFQDFEVESCRAELLAKKGILAAATPEVEEGVKSVKGAFNSAVGVGKGVDRGTVPLSTPLSTLKLPPTSGSQSPISQDASRCLACGSVCELCVDVCPNRANISLDIAHIAHAVQGNQGFWQDYQIIHLDRLCNECGNCGVFCPTAGNPYLDKLTLFSDEVDFEDSKNRGFVALEDGSYRLRLADGNVLTTSSNDAIIPKEYAAVINTIKERHQYLLLT